MTKKIIRLLAPALAAFLAGGVCVHAGTTDDLDARLSRLPRPWANKVERLTMAEYEATLNHWAARYPKLVTVQRRGQSNDGLGVYLVKITDSAVSDEDKQVALVTTLHGGPERVGVTTALSLISWLLGGSELAAETRRRQVILVMPMLNPHAFFVSERFANAEGIDVYDAPQERWDLEKIALKDPAKMPELAAMASVIDEYRPEVHLDMHGTGLQAIPRSELEDRRMLQGHTMFEVSGSYSRIQVRSWDPRVTEAMVQAGHQAGYGSNRAEADAQRNFWLPDHDMLASRLWDHDRRTGRFRSLFYGYMRYHTMISTMEIGWEESGVARVAGVLALGNRPWVYELAPGYPVNRVRASSNRFVTAYGQTAEERRRSRVELWAMQAGFVTGMLYPEYEGRATYVCAVTEAGRKMLDSDPARFAENLRAMPGVRAEAVAAFVAAGPEHRLTAATQKTASAKRPQHGIGFRFCVPYLSPELLDVAVNGHSLAVSDTDGYRAWPADGYTQVQVNIPPEKSRGMDIFVVTCAYDPRERRSTGFELPAAVREQLRSSGAPARR